MKTDSKDQLRDERRDQIKKAALKVFATHGLIGTKMSMIAKEAQISDGLSYRYFKSKDEILSELVKEAIEGSNETFDVIRTMPGTPLEKVRLLTSEILHEDNYYFILMQQVLSSEDLPGEVAELLKGYDAGEMIRVLTDVVAAGQEAGQFIAGDARVLTMWYLTSVVGLMNVRTAQIDDYRLPDADFMLRLIVQP
ncbi:TetR/AcrR family transcriptional regulator [Paenibacillus doosanensis]|uniref:Fatty acid metabolism regulator protein n=1 Tax=Paenibacillus konkukensis TaxID=2020716 RepID=A0ABY4RFK6_9BACL|nr:MULTISPECIES: TetR/AcrR family transcriptional regulator [Paenibacillus]MCS7464103.1 TetR/AcrR family transcriptional regulator [Paenibacillus doosanensis]UQZ81336.1 Fatty acid metabolism regulator protein [Paenibacillus konkukensis]